MTIFYDNFSVMVASHNLDSIRYAVELSKKWKIAPSEFLIFKL